MDFELLETCLYTNQIYLFDFHWQRLINSAKYFGFKMPKKNILHQNFLPNSCVRFTLDKDGTIDIINKNLNQLPALYLENNQVILSLASSSIDVDIKEFYLHKTTYRKHYEYNIPYTDVVLHNNGYITECTKANIAILKDNIWYTPKGILLAGTLRQYLLYFRKLIVKDLSIDDLMMADKIIYFNSLRGIFKANLSLDI